MSCTCTELEVAAFLWWVSTRPAGWTEAQHLEDPAALRTTSDAELLTRRVPSAAEIRLCYAVAERTKQLREAVALARREVTDAS